MSTRSNSPYIPSFIKSAIKDVNSVQQTSADAGTVDSNSRSIDSFKYDPLNYPLKNTQQLNVDWSSFENHTFFSSAEVKVNDAFNNIINRYPFDGTKAEIEKFFDTLTGYEKWLFDNFPKWSGALLFSGTQVGEDPSGGYQSGLGTWIQVVDKSGYLLPDASKTKTGFSVLNPTTGSSFTIEMQLYVPNINNDVQIIAQKATSQTHGFSLHLTSSTSTNVDAVFSIASGSYQNNVSGTLFKGKYNHICVSLNRASRENTLDFYLNETLVNSSVQSVTFDVLDIDDTTPLLIGTGSAFYSNQTLVTPKQTLSGVLDEFRLFHSLRSSSIQKMYAQKGLYSTEDLKLYYRFNEPALIDEADDFTKSIVLDSSGNSLHSTISNFTSSLRINAENDLLNPVSEERPEFKTILFPMNSQVMALNEQLLSSASLYDQHNPNIITRLIPHHYLLEGAADEGYNNVEGNAGNAYTGKAPGQGIRGSTQIILSFLYIWAKFFDEIKLYVDAFGTLRTVDYDTNATIPDNFLEDLVESYGLYIPKFFNHATVQQYAEGENIDGLTTSENTLKKLQALLLRRVLVNMPDIVKSKGTQHSIRSFLRSIGIDPDNSLKIREYGGSTVKQLTTSREKKTAPGAMVDFVSSSLVVSPALSGSRIEPGYPHPMGSFIVDTTTHSRTGTTYASDGMYTSGSWTVEALYKFPPQKLSSITDADGNQSLMRMYVTGSSASAKPGVVLNVVAKQYKNYPRVPSSVIAYARPGNSGSSPTLTLELELDGYGIFDGDKWNVSVGCMRNDSISSNSSSYFLRVGKSNEEGIEKSYMTSSYFTETPSSELNVFRNIDSATNASGSYIAIGKNQNIPTGIGYLFLNNSLSVIDEARTTDFVGWSSNVRFWSKGMSEDEWKEHVRNYTSLGVTDPYTNYNFVNNVSGSFEKLRVDTLTKQQNRTADTSGNLDFLDFSLNDMTFVGTGFVTSSKVIVGDMFNYSYLSPSFDEAATQDKIRIRSYEDPSRVAESNYAVKAPTYLFSEAFMQEEPVDDVRLSIELSMVDALDKDISNMFATFDELNNAIGDPSLMYSPDYPRLEVLRDIYFNRLSEKMNFRKFLEFYRWFDISVTSFIEQLLPNKTHYKGANFVIESHMLERHKREYYGSEKYMGDKRVISDSLLVQQLSGILKKY